MIFTSIFPSAKQSDKYYLYPVQFQSVESSPENKEVACKNLSCAMNMDESLRDEWNFNKKLFVRDLALA